MAAGLFFEFAPVFFMPVIAAVPAMFGTPVADLAILLLFLLRISVWIAMIVGGVLIMCADGTHPAMIVVAAVLMLAPCVNLLVLLLINRGATRALRKAGIRVGFMGANQDDVERAVNFELCKGCGYNLTGNTSGFCPECGRAIDTRFCMTCGYNLTGNASGVCPECGQAVGHVVSAPPMA